MLQNRPWIISNFLLVIQEWPADQTLDKLQFNHSPFWVQIVGLSPNRITSQNGRTIGDFLGGFLELDPDSINATEMAQILIIKQ